MYNYVMQHSKLWLFCEMEQVIRCTTMHIPRGRQSCTAPPVPMNTPAFYCGWRIAQKVNLEIEICILSPIACSYFRAEYCGSVPLRCVTLSKNNLLSGIKLKLHAWGSFNISWTRSAVVPREEVPHLPSSYTVPCLCFLGLVLG